MTLDDFHCFGRRSFVQLFGKPVFVALQLRAQHEAMVDEVKRFTASLDAGRGDYLLVQPGDFQSLPDDRLEKMAGAAREVCRLLGMSKDEIEGRQVMTFFPFARGEHNTDTAAASRWAVREMIVRTGENRELLASLRAHEASYPLPAYILPKPLFEWEKRKK